MMRRTLSGLMGVLMLLAAVNARAQGPLDAVPRTASVLLRLKAPDATIKKVAEFAGKIDRNAGAQVQGFAPMLGVLISNPTMAGVDRTKDWHVAVFARSDMPPALVFVIPAQDANAMQQALGQQFKSFAKGPYLLYSEDAETIEQLQSAGEESISKAIGAATQKLIDGSDVSVFVNVPRVREVYAEQLDEARGKIDEAIEQMKTIQPPQAGVSWGEIWDMYGNAAKGALQAIEDTNGFAITLTVQPQGVSFVDYVDVASGTKTAEYLADSKPGDIALLSKMPREALAYAGAHGNMAALGKWGMQMSMSMFKDDEEKREAIENVMKEYEKLEFGGYALAFDLGDTEEGLLRTYALMDVKPVNAMRELSRKSAEAFGELEAPGFKQTMEYKPGAEKYGNRAADVIITKQEFTLEGDAAAGNAMAQQMMEAMWGPEGMKQQLVYMEDKNLVAQTMGGGRAAMEQLLKGVDTSTSGPTLGAAGKTREVLPKEANFLGMVDLPRLLSRGAQLVAQSGQIPIPIDAEAIGSIEIEPSYTGLSVALAKESVRVDTYVPLEQIQGVVKLVQGFMQQMQNQQQQF